MTPEHEDTLRQTFPALYRNGMHFAVGDGWFDLLFELGAKLAAVDPDAIAAQVKEKFAQLRFYTTTGTNDAGGEAIAAAEHLSATTCEQCGGAGGAKRKGHWIKTLCVECSGDEDEWVSAWDSSK